MARKLTSSDVPNPLAGIDSFQIPQVPWPLDPLLLPWPPVEILPERADDPGLGLLWPEETMLDSQGFRDSLLTS